MSDISADLVEKTFVELTRTLVGDYDPIEFLQLLTTRCAEVLDVTYVGISFVDDAGRVQVLASSSERMRIIDLIEAQQDNGPCIEVWRSGVPVWADMLANDTARWPRFAPAARAAGFESAYVLPLRLRDQHIGALSVFVDRIRGLALADRVVGQAFADTATLAILNERFLREPGGLLDQLQAARTSRIVIESAKGILAEQGQLDVDEAFVRILGHARGTARKLTHVALDVVEGRKSVGYTST